MSQIVCDRADKGILLTFDELQILLYSCGVKEWEGIVIPGQPSTEQDVLHAIHHLTQKGIITEKAGTFTIRGDVKEMLRVMGSPKRTEILEFQQEYFCYEDGQIVVVSERYWKRKSTIKLRLFEQQEFQKWKGGMTDDNR